MRFEGATVNDCSQSISHETISEESILLSVCIITYNHGKYIAQAIDSVLAQKTTFPFEIIIGEDGSSDETSDIVMSYRDRYPDKIRVLSQDRKNVIYINGRATGRYNFLETLSDARGKYIAPLEGDDFWIDVDKLQQQVEFLDANPQIAVCGHWVSNVDEYGKTLEKQMLTGERCPHTFLMRDVFDGIPLHLNSLVIRKKCLARLSEYPLTKKIPALDNYLMLILMLYGQGCCIPKTMSAYRIHSGGIWTSVQRHQKMFEGIQFRLSAMDFVHGLDRVVLTNKLIHNASIAIARLFVEVARTKSLSPLFDWIRFLRCQETMSYTVFFLVMVGAVVYLPFGLLIFISRFVKKLNPKWNG